MDIKLLKVEPHSKYRCVCVGDRGEIQCSFMSVEGLFINNKLEYEDYSTTVEQVTGIKNCPKHNGLSMIKGRQKAAHKTYLSNQWARRVEQLSNDEEALTLRTELGVTKMVVDSILRICHDEHELLLHSAKLSRLINDAEKLTKTIDSIEHRRSLVLDQAGAMSLASRIVDIITSSIDDEETCKKITRDVANMVAKMGEQ